MKNEFIEQDNDLSKLLLPEFRSDIPESKLPSKDDFFKSIENSGNPILFLLNELETRAWQKQASRDLSNQQVDILLSIEQQIQYILSSTSPTSLKNSDWNMFMLGLQIGSFDTSSLMSRHTMKSIQQTSRNMKKGQALQKKQLIVVELIVSLYSTILSTTKFDESYSKEDLYEAIHQRILEYLRHCDDEDIRGLFKVYKKRQACKVDKFSKHYYSPSIDKISEVLLRVEKSEVDVQEDRAHHELECLSKLISQDKRQLSLSHLSKVLSKNIKNKEISTFLAFKIKNL